MSDAARKKASAARKESRVENFVTAMPAAAKAVSVDVLRPEIEAEITNSALDMVRAMIQNAKDGQYQAMKYLFDLVGLYPAKIHEQSSGNGSPEGLLAQLEIP